MSALPRADSETWLEALGWGEPFASALEPHAAQGREPGRVVAEDRGLYLVATAGGEIRAEVAMVDFSGTQVIAHVGGAA